MSSMTESKHVYAKDTTFWTNYLKGRPQVPDSFFERIFAYHTEHGGRFETVHDAGAGGGIHSASLARRFKRVIVTDVSEQNIDVARSLLEGSSYEFHAAKLEDTTFLPAASVDMVFGASMMHFTNVDKALEVVARQLRPGGTFACPLMGICRFDNSLVQRAWLRLFNVACEQLIDRVGEANIGQLYCNATAYDSIAIPEAFFQPDSLRIKINETIKDYAGGHYYLYLVPPDIRAKYPPVSRIQEAEKIISEVDDDWSFTKSFSELKEILTSFPFDYETEAMRDALKELEAAAGDQSVTGHWIVTLILATRNMN